MAATPPNLGEIQNAFAADLTGERETLQPPPPVDQPVLASPPEAPPADSGTEILSEGTPGVGEEPTEQHGQPAIEQPTGGQPAIEPVDPDEFNLDDEPTSEEETLSPEQQEQPGQEAKPDATAIPAPDLTEDQEKLIAQIEELAGTDPERVMAAALKTNRGRRMHASFKITQELAKPEADGGIGFVPSEDQLKEHYKAHVTLATLNSHLSSGDPARVQNWIKIHFGRSQETYQNPQTGQTDYKQFPGTAEVMEGLPETLLRENPAALNILANKLPDVLARNPAVFREHAKPFQLLTADQLLQMVNNASGEEQEIRTSEKSRLMDAAKLVHFAVTGQWPDDSALGLPGGAAQTGQPSTETQQWRQRAQTAEQRLQQQTQQQVRTTTTGYENQIRGSLDEALSADVDKALKVLKDRSTDEVLFDSLRDRFLQQMRGVIDQNPTQRRILEDQIAQAAQAGNLGIIPALVQSQRQLYRGSIKTSRPTYLKAAGIPVMERNSARNAQLQHASSRTEVNGGVQVPTAKVVGTAGPAEKQPGETQQRFMERTFKMALTPSG